MPIPRYLLGEAEPLVISLYYVVNLSPYTRHFAGVKIARNSGEGFKFFLDVNDS